MESQVNLIKSSKNQLRIAIFNQFSRDCSEDFSILTCLLAVVCDNLSVLKDSIVLK